jgi:hypothetical protein
VAEWLSNHGVPNDYFQIVHHEVDNLTAVFKKLPQTPVIIHTHYKLKGSSYTTQYFQYKGKPRDLLIFDESMLNSMVTAKK